MGFDHHGKQKRDHNRLNHDIREHESLNDRIDGESAHRNIRKDRSCAAHTVTDAEQQHIRGTLQNCEANDRVYKVPTGDEPVKPAEEEPRSNEVRKQVKKVRHGIISPASGR